MENSCLRNNDNLCVYYCWLTPDAKQERKRMLCMKLLRRQVRFVLTFTVAID